jgi:rRNA-processing protein FCF1
MDDFRGRVGRRVKQTPQGESERLRPLMALAGLSGGKVHITEAVYAELSVLAEVKNFWNRRVEGAKVQGVVVIYARVKSDTSLWEYCVRRGWDNLRVVSDARELMKAVRAGKVEIVLCSTLSGMARSTSQLVQVLKEFVAHGVALFIPSAGIDTSKVSSEVFLGLLDDIDEFKRSVAVERINAGLAAAKARGIKLGRSRTLDAYREDVAG